MAMLSETTGCGLTDLNLVNPVPQATMEALSFGRIIIATVGRLLTRFPQQVPLLQTYKVQSVLIFRLIHQTKVTSGAQPGRQ